MIARRDLLIGSACLVAAGASTALKARREEPLLKGARMADVVPAALAGWTSQDMGDPYAVNGEKTLSNKLYNELVVRQYVNREASVAITMLLAYGARQSDELQLHRPEVCYPAFGFNVLRNEPLMLTVGGATTLPARRLAAQNDDHRENIIYWSRMGELLPQDGSQQRAARLKIAMQGIIPDGLLARFSTSGDYPDQDWRMISAFIVELVAAMAPERRKVLLGTERADRLKSIPMTART